jgi:hypothetical protein
MPMHPLLFCARNAVVLWLLLVVTVAFVADLITGHI